MGIYADYVGQYSDLANAFNANNADGYNFQKLWQINPARADYYLSSKGLSGSDLKNINWDHYVWTGGSATWSPSNGNSDLENAWNQYRAAYPSGMTKAQWGAKHWNDYGSKEGRSVPYNALDTVVWNKVQYAVRHAQLYNYSYIPNVYQNASGSFEAVDGIDGWGSKHWNEYGKNEPRILPGAKISVDSNGNLSLDESTIGSGLRQNYRDIVRVFNESTGGNYKGIMEGIPASLGGSDSVAFKDLAANGGLNALSASYQKLKAQPWDARTQGAQPPTGSFDPDYYAINTQGGQTATNTWNSAQSSVNVGGYYFADLDIVGKFSKNTYLQWYYTNYGKSAGERGNAAESTDFVNEYTEYLTDRDYQQYREQVLGLVPEGGTGTTLLEGQLSTVLTAKDQQQQQMFGALTTDSLRQALAELQKAKAKEQEFSFYQQFPQLSEVTSINQTIADSLLGDVGIGGLLGWSGDPEKIQQQFEQTVGQVTGIPSRNSTVYNWQKWFDEQLVTRYAEGNVITDPNDPNVTYTLDAAFAQDYIDRYLKPRFDTSRSMGEFISYMDVQQNEQNIFQTQSALDSLKQIADIRAKAYLDQVRQVSNPALGGTVSVFDPNFYWNPTGNLWDEDPKKQLYETQKQKVESDYQIATTQGDTALVPGTNLTWNQWAYTYGLNLNDKQQFAKLHYQVYGAANGYDPAKDIITLKDADDYIKTSILPAISDEKLNLGEVSFLNFVTPEEFADKMLEGISIEENQEEWEKLLETLGLSGKDMGLEEVKQYIIETFQTDAAKAIREGIKYLNEKKKTPSQAELGVEYIERPEDKKTVISENETELYKIFRNAGYQGSEDEFYDKFMTDIDRGEMQLITQGQKGLQLSGDFAGLTSEDPFEAVFSMEKLFADEDTTKKTTTDEDEEAPSYFRLFEDDTDEDYKSEAGTKILGEFTSFLKGFN